MAQEIAPTGSRWYAWGHHWRVIGQGTRDGEPAVRLKKIITGRTTRARYDRPTVITRLLDRYGTRKET